ncbi:polysaccharide lyase [Archangium lipolyticum]|uniref:polysaccharide lyase n=1 Tax=Archangium lipolyticum TaxID=2970465 RepID=UPI00214A6398|nr:polysaccharide lyase [Archangium lipolyticum]
MRELLVSLLAVLMPGLSWAGVVWKGDFETGNLGQYSSVQQVSTDRLQVVQSPAFQGRYALKATVRQGDDPINSSGNRNELIYKGREQEGSEYYYRWQVMFAPDYPSVKTWQVFTQWHHNGCCGSPPVEFFVYGEELRLTLTDSVTPWTTKLDRGVWHDFIFHVKWSPDPSVGFVELWHNGRRVLPRYMHATMYAGDGIYLKLGLYRSDTVQQVGVVYHDGFVQATRLDDVLPPAPAPAPDAGTPTPAPDAGTSPGDEEPPPVVPTSPWPDSPTPSTFPDDPPHAGCSSAGGTLWAVALLGLGGLLRRMRRR